MSIPTDVQNNIKSIGFSIVSTWLKDQGVTIAGSSNNFFDVLSESIESGLITLDELKSGLVVIEEHSSQKALLNICTNTKSLSKDQEKIKGRLRSKGIIFSKTPSFQKPKSNSPSFLYATWDEDRLKIKFGEKQIKRIFDPDLGTHIEEDIFFSFILLLDFKTGLTQFRFTSPTGNVHTHKQNGKSSRIALEKYYLEKITEWFPEIKLTPLPIHLIARYFRETYAKDVLRLHREINTVTGGYKQTIESPNDRADIRDNLEVKEGEKAGGSSWVSDDLVGYWQYKSTDGELTRNLHITLNRQDSVFRIQRGCLEKEFNFALNKIFDAYNVVK